MTRSTHAMSLLLALTLPGCATTIPQGTGAEGVPDINYQLTELKDARWAQCEQPDLDDALTEIMNDPDWNMVGCAAGWGNEGEVVYLTAQGSMTEDDPETWLEGDAIPYDIHTVQPIGSVSKIMTSLAMLRLVEMGRVSLDDTVHDHLGYLVEHQPAWVQAATVGDLLSHRGGFNDALVTVELTKDDSSSRVALDAAYYTDVDWESWGFTNDQTWGRRPAAAVVPLVLPPTGVIEPAEGEGGTYSNISYLYAGAIIDAVVSQDDFDGFDGYPLADTMERTYEAWVWWVLSGEGQLEPYSMWTPVLRHPWRLDDDAYDHLADGYYAPGVPITRLDEPDEYGWIAPSGGWMMTIGDLVRLGTIISEREVLDQVQGDILYESMWTQMLDTHSMARGAGYGYGITKYSGPLTGHGGTNEGYVSGTFASKGKVVSFQCNTSPLTGGGGHTALHAEIGGILLGAFDPAVEATCPEPGEWAGLGLEYDAIDVLSTEYFADEYASLSAAVSRYGLEEAFANEEAALARDTTGAALLYALAEGDWDRAAQCALVGLGDRHGRWSCR